MLSLSLCRRVWPQSSVPLPPPPGYYGGGAPQQQASQAGAAPAGPPGAPPAGGMYGAAGGFPGGPPPMGFPGAPYGGGMGMGMGMGMRPPHMGGMGMGMGNMGHRPPMGMGMGMGMGGAPSSGGVAPTYTPAVPFPPESELLSRPPPAANCDPFDETYPTYNIFVGDMTPDFSEADLYAAYQPAGPIHSVNVVRDKMTGAAKGFGSVGTIFVLQVEWSGRCGGYMSRCSHPPIGTPYGLLSSLARLPSVAVWLSLFLSFVSTLSQFR